MATKAPVVTAAEKRLAEFLERYEDANEAIEELMEARRKAILMLREFAQDAHDIWMEDDHPTARSAIFIPAENAATELGDYIDNDGDGSAFTFDGIATMQNDVNDLVEFAYRHALAKLVDGDDAA
jgi:hypothetical protein